MTISTWNRMKDVVNSSYGLHTYLLVVFFILFRCSQAFFYLTLFEVAIVSIVLLCLIFLANKFFSFVLSKKTAASYVFVTTLFLPSLFFTSLIDLFKRMRLVDQVQWNRETVLYLLVFWVVIFVFLFKNRKPIFNFCRYLNILFLALILYQVSVLIVKTGKGEGSRAKLATAASMDLPIKHLTAADSLPDIYFFIFDGYTGNAELRKEWNFDNSEISGFLQDRNFHVSDSAISAYNYTPICLSSIFNMNYQVAWFKELNDPYWGLTQYLSAIKNNQYCRILKQNGYSLFNLSFFELNDQPVFTSFKAYSPARNFCRFCLENCILLRFFNNPYNAEQGKNNLKVFEEATTIIRSKKEKKFVYGHFMLPHPAFFFDSSGTYYSRGEGKYKNENENYIEQLKYTNSLIKKLTDSILFSNANSVIIIQGDHGSRLKKNGDGITSSVESHQPFSAVYFPRLGAVTIQEPLYTPNIFRLFLNKYFNADLSLLPMAPDHFLKIK